MNRLLPWLIPILILLAGCSPEADDVRDYTLFNIVTYENTADSDTHLTLYLPGDSGSLSLTAKWIPSRQIAPGTRLLVAYTTDRPLESSTIHLLQAASIYGGNFYTRPTLSSLTPALLWLNSLWRTGPYINLDANAEFANTHRHLSLILNESSLHTPYPEMLITQQADTPEWARQLFDQRIYASWAVDSILSLPGVKGIKVILNNANTHSDTILIK